MTESETKHTPGELTTGPSHLVKRVFHLPDGRRCTQILAQCYGYADAGDGHAVDPAANAARIVLTWNCHDELVAACRCALGHLTGNMDGDMDLGDPAELLRAALSRATS